MTAAAKLPTSPVRDLFEGYLPSDNKEERKLGYPDITFIVRRKDANSPYPSQIDFKSAKPAPNENQLRSLRKGANEIISLYCPEGTLNPY